MSEVDIRATLVMLAGDSRRCIHATKLFEADKPTQWDLKHQAIDTLLDQLERACEGKESLNPLALDDASA